MTDEERRVIDIGPARLLIGLVQGLMLYVLAQAVEANGWGKEPLLLSSLMLVTALVPITALAGLSGMRPLTLGAWTIATIAAIVGLVAHRTSYYDVAEALPALFAALPPALFVAYHLVAAADADGRPLARYRTYFDVGWKNGVQLALSLAFVGAFWILLALGAALFALINITVVREIIQERWFYFPATTTAFAAAVHISDARFGLIAGARTLALMVLSWLLPVMALFAVAFLAALAFVGLQPLWATGSTTPLLLISAMMLVLLINATYQDGEQETPPPAVLRLGARIAALTVAPLVAIAFYSVWLRIDQHGLTPDRVVAMACVAVAACYAAGYAVAALWPGRWLKPIEITNILASFVALALTLALLTPIADPAGIAVADQVRRLQTGAAALEEFDFNFLRFRAGRYGHEALERLRADKSSDRARAIAAKADEAIKRDYPGPVTPPLPPVAELLAKIAVHPLGASLPPTFVQQAWAASDWPPNCARQGCDAFLIDFDRDGQPDVLLVSRIHGVVYKLTANGRWTMMGTVDPARCGVSIEALRAGRFAVVAPKTAELEIEGKRLQVSAACPETTPPKASPIPLP